MLAYVVCTLQFYRSKSVWPDICSRVSAGPPQLRDAAHEQLTQAQEYFQSYHVSCYMQHQACCDRALAKFRQEAMARAPGSSPVQLLHTFLET